MPATTFIIKEGGVEVGRYSESDGLDRTEVIENGGPAAPEAQDKKPPEQELPMPAQKQELKASWTMMGTVLDVLHLKNITAGKIIFSNGENNIEVPIQWNGSFSVKVPKLETGGYLVSAMLPDGRRVPALLGTGGAFKTMDYAQRLRLRNIKQMQSPLQGHSMDLEVGLYPEKLTKQEEEDYKKAMQQPAA